MVNSISEVKQNQFFYLKYGVHHGFLASYMELTIVFYLKYGVRHVFLP